MDVLEAVVAFALAMVVFSTMVSALVEGLFHRLLNLRERGLEHVVCKLFEDVLWPRFQADILQDKGPLLGSQENAKQTRDDVYRSFRSEMVRNRAVADDEELNRLARAWRRLTRWMLPGRVNKLDSVEFIERLARSDIGRVMARRGVDQVKVVVEDLALQFDRLGENYSRFFRYRAQTLSLLAAIVFAFVVNIDAVRLFHGLMQDPEARQQLLAQADAIAERHQALINQQSQSADAEGSESAQELDTLKAQAKEDIDAVRSRLSELQADGLVFGQDYYPFCKMMASNAEEQAAPGGAQTATRTYVRVSDDPACARLAESFRSRVQGCEAFFAGEGATPGDLTRGFCETWHSIPPGTVFAAGLPATVNWLVVTFFSGLLIGLGGPFWFNVFSKLSQVLQMARGLTNAFRPKKAAEESGAEDKAGETEDIKPNTVFEAFERVRRAETDEAAVRPRRILGPGGTPL